ncbi:uncharacterized protein LOC122954064 isoform X1 [Acropora millepora]|uniref:uncharacterized protein LOC122954064 isoform X1 n=1 Tax=Acropora millepora TaxID=45264 RepID=UPI001CF4AB95|nr:uncharacterized protein LOC122954064 isoform X1 [Acropora millepora]
MILFLSAGCHEFALSKVILHVHIQNGWTWKPFTIFCASNIAMKRQKSTEHNNSELENSSSTQKNKCCVNPVQKKVTAVSKRLDNMDMVVVKLQFRNHVDLWCKPNCNPHNQNEFRELRFKELRILRHLLRWIKR